MHKPTLPACIISERFSNDNLKVFSHYFFLQQQLIPNTRLSPPQRVSDVPLEE